jgi:hypothetical protein
MKTPTQDTAQQETLDVIIQIVSGTLIIPRNKDLIVGPLERIALTLKTPGHGVTSK